MKNRNLQIRPGYTGSTVEFINFERKCCPGITYSLMFEPEEGPIHLRIGGSTEIKGMLKSMLGEIDRE